MREDAGRFAAELGVPVWFVEVRCAADVARERLARRAAAGTDPSDAGPEHYSRSARKFESPSEWPDASRAIVHTDQDDWRASLPALAEWIRALGP